MPPVPRDTSQCITTVACWFYQQLEDHRFIPCTVHHVNSKTPWDKHRESFPCYPCSLRILVPQSTFRSPQQIILEQIKDTPSRPRIQSLPVDALVQTAIAARRQPERGLIGVLRCLIDPMVGDEREVGLAEEAFSEVFDAVILFSSSNFARKELEVCLFLTYRHAFLREPFASRLCRRGSGSCAPFDAPFSALGLSVCCFFQAFKGLSMFLTRQCKA